MSRGGGIGGGGRSGGLVVQRNQDATIWVGNLAEEVTEPLLLELFTQMGRVVRVNMPRDKVLDRHQRYAFVEFRTEESAEYASVVMNMVRLFGQPLRISLAGGDVGRRKTLDVGANLFIGNLTPEVDSKILHDAFASFGRYADSAYVAVDEDTDRPLGYGFVSYDSFEASDAAIDAMDGQFFCGRQISVQYAFKKNASKKGERERHGSAAERLLAANRPGRRSNLQPHMHFADKQGGTPWAGMIPQHLPGFVGGVPEMAASRPMHMPLAMGPASGFPRPPPLAGMIPPGGPGILHGPGAGIVPLNSAPPPPPLSTIPRGPGNFVPMLMPSGAVPPPPLVAANNFPNVGGARPPPLQPSTGFPVSRPPPLPLPPSYVQ